jgi:glucose/arabinose dehydrogenase
MVLIGHDLYLADTDALLRFPYEDGDTKIDALGVKVTDLPAGPINLHWTKNVVASRDGSKLFVTVGSNSNVGKQGFDDEKDRAAILEVDPESGASRLFASGLRNPNGLAFEPQSGALWTTVNERDMLGSDLVPDYMMRVEEGGFYGWPYSYFGQHLDPRIKPQRPELVAKAIVPDYALGAHTASLGRRRLYRSARLLEPHPQERLQGDLCALRRRQALGSAGRHPHRVHRSVRLGTGTARRRRRRPHRRRAGGG